jgi:hypothetical protein
MVRIATEKVSISTLAIHFLKNTPTILFIPIFILFKYYFSIFFYCFIFFVSLFRSLPHPPATSLFPGRSTPTPLEVGRTTLTHYHQDLGCPTQGSMASTSAPTGPSLNPSTSTSNCPPTPKTQNRCDRWWLLEQQVLLLLGDENGPAYVEADGQGHVDGVDIWVVKDSLVRCWSFGRLGQTSASAQREETGAYSEERRQRRGRGVDVGPRLLWWARERSERKREEKKKNSRYVNTE